MEKMGTVTQISSMFPPQEAQKASKRVQDAIGERQQQLDRLKGFLDDNASLINHVQKLPDETHHNIMVPFGKAAFFPGRLIHTNEFMVLLGEGYYSERTAKQTIEILKRRGRDIETQVDSLKAVMQDLKAEASFFDTTAAESAEGLVEIREDYADEDSFGTSPGYNKNDSTPVEVSNKKAADEDEEFIRIKMRMDELEKEEEEAERADGSDEDEGIQNQPDNRTSQNSIVQEARSSRVEASEVPLVSKDSNNLSLNNSMTSKALEQPPQDMKEVEAPPNAGNMAFTGSIVEHAHNIGMQLPQQQGGSRGSKPVSRFKMMQQRK